MTHSRTVINPYVCFIFTFTFTLHYSHTPSSLSCSRASALFALKVPCINLSAFGTPLKLGYKRLIISLHSLNLCSNSLRNSLRFIFSPHKYRPDLARHLQTTSLSSKGNTTTFASMFPTVALFLTPARPAGF